MIKRTIYTVLFFIYCFFMLWLAAKPAHAQSYFKGPALVETPTALTVSGATTTLTKDSQTVQRFSGSNTQTVVLPNATTLPLGRYYFIANDTTTGNITVKDASNTTLSTVLSTNSASFRLTANGVSAGTWTVENNYTAIPATGISGIVPLANGGTNLANVASQGGAAYGTSTGISLNAAGSAGQYLRSNGTSAPTWSAVSVSGEITGVLPVANGGTGTSTAFTPGSVVFAGASGIYDQDNASLFFDNSNNRLGIGTASPGVKLDVVGPASAQLRLSDTTTDATNKLSYITARHYSNAEEDVLLLLNNNSSSSNVITYGGGSGILNAATEIRFNTAATNTTTVGTQRMTIDSAGEVGIGTSSPNYKLEVLAAGLASSTNYDVTNIAESSTGKGVKVGYFTNSGGTAVQEGRLKSSGSIPLALGTSNFPQAVYILDTTGFVGILTTTPSVAMDVNGSARVRGLTTAGPVQTDTSGNLSSSATLPLASGGTNANITASHGGLAYSTASAISIGPVSAVGTVLLGNGAAAYSKTAVGVSGQYLKSEGSANPVWTNTLNGTVNVVNKTTTYTATTNDDVITVTTGSAWTLTLYAASGNSGRVLRIKKTSNDTNALTIDGNASETIDGSTTTSINTQYEELAIVCDGSNWHILSRTYPSAWVAYTPTFVGFGTPTSVNVFSRRVGDSLQLRGTFSTGTVTASTASITLGFNGTNSNVTLDTSKVASGITHVGQWASSTITNNYQDNVLVDSGATGVIEFGYQNGSQGGLTALAGNVAFGNSQGISFFATIPISGWK